MTLMSISCSRHMRLYFVTLPIDWRHRQYCIESRIVRLHGLTPSAAPRHASVVCSSAATIELTVPTTAVPVLIQLAVAFDFIEARRRNIGSVGSRPVADLRRGSGRRCRLYLDVIVTSLVRRVTLPTDSPLSSPVRSTASVPTQQACRLHQSSTVQLRRLRPFDRVRRRRYVKS